MPALVGSTDSDVECIDDRSLGSISTSTGGDAIDESVSCCSDAASDASFYTCCSDGPGDSWHDATSTVSTQAQDLYLHHNHVSLGAFLLVGHTRDELDRFFSRLSVALTENNYTTQDKNS